MPDVGNITGTQTSAVQQQVAAAALNVANQTAQTAADLVEQAAEQAGPIEAGKGHSVDEQA